MVRNIDLKGLLFTLCLVQVAGTHCGANGNIINTRDECVYCGP